MSSQKKLIQQKEKELLEAKRVASFQKEHNKAAAFRPQVTVYTIHGKKTPKSIRIPDVLISPIRQDIVNFVHTNMAKNSRQPYGVQVHFGPKGIVAGHQVSARSWGTGRAVSRIPRVRGSGTHRAGQGAFGNMCRGARMFAPTKVWRKWHRKINKNQKRYAVASALSASAVPALVMARGHRIQAVSEIPLVVSDDFSKVRKTKNVNQILRALKLGNELNRCKHRTLRAGKGKLRNRRFRHRLGPLVIFKEDNGFIKGGRNIRGLEFCNVFQLNLLKLAPGGHCGRMIIWTESAFSMLNTIFGTHNSKSSLKAGYSLPRPLVMNSDLRRIIQSPSIQNVLRARREGKSVQRKRNPLKDPKLYAKLNPLFDREWSEKLEKKFKGKNISTLKMIKPAKKKIKLKVTEQDKAKMKKYWEMVLGETLFKTRAQLEAENKAVEAARILAEREKLGLDIE